MRLKDDDEAPQVRLAQQAEQRRDLRRMVRVVREHAEPLARVEAVLAAAHSGKFSERGDADFPAADERRRREREHCVLRVERSRDRQDERPARERAALLAALPNAQDRACARLILGEASPAVNTGTRSPRARRSSRALPAGTNTARRVRSKSSRNVRSRSASVL